MASFKLFTTTITLVSLSSFLLTQVTSDPDNGWNANINWQPSMDAFYEKIKSSKKPGMLIIHKSWCGACKQLRPKFAASTKLEKLAEEFVMINTLDDEEPSGAEFQPDGGYIPRILFFDPESQKPLPEFKNSGRSDYKYFYSNADDIIKSMTAVSEHFRPLFTKEENDMRTEEQKRAAERNEL